LSNIASLGGSEASCRTFYTV